MKKSITKYDIQEIEGYYKMNQDNIEQFAECSALAYKEYPLFQYLTNGTYDYAVIKTIMYASIYAIKNQVIGFANDKEANAIAIFAPPYYTGSKTIPFLLGGGIRLGYIAPPSTFLRLLNYENYAMKLKKHYTNHKCWYLYNITVKPQFQNNGNCSKILNPMFEYLDRVGQDCYLETHKESNVELYKHFNFELLETSNIPKTDIKHYAMIRKAK